MSYQSLDIPGSPPSQERNRLNTVEHFASSFSRSVSFRSLESPFASRSFLSVDDEGEIDEAVFDDDDDFIDTTSLLGTWRRETFSSTNSSRRRQSVYTAPPPKGTHLLQETDASGQPLVIRKLADDETGEITTMVAGQSTVPQTIFNSVNVLIGVGLLALPLGFKYSGWLIGGLMLAVAAVSTFYTAILLSKCLDTDYSLLTFADIAYAAFGQRARIMVAILFTIELLGAGIALVVLLADSLNALFPSISIIGFKMIAFFVLTPMTFLPLRVLSLTSIMGIICTISLVFIVLFNGLIKPDAPGSLVDPMATWWFPRSWRAVPLAIGLLFSPFGGLPCLVSIRVDMRHPQKYAAAMINVYVITVATDAAMGVIGFLMYGESTLDEITKNLLTSEGVPEWVPFMIAVLVTLVPLSKCPLNALPICHTLDVLLGVERVQFSKSSSISGQITKASIRISVVAATVVLAVVFPDFDRVIAFAGSLLCISTCILLPCAFYLKIFYDTMPRWEKLLQWTLLVTFSIIAVLGTVYSLLPHEYFE